MAVAEFEEVEELYMSIYLSGYLTSLEIDASSMTFPMSFKFDSEGKIIPFCSQDLLREFMRNKQLYNRVMRICGEKTKPNTQIRRAFETLGKPKKKGAQNTSPRKLDSLKNENPNPSETDRLTSEHKGPTIPRGQVHDIHIAGPEIKTEDVHLNQIVIAPHPENQPGLTTDLPVHPSALPAANQDAHPNGKKKSNPIACGPCTLI